MSTKIHPVVHKNRNAKAQRIVDFMDNHPNIFADVTAEVAAEFGPEVWALINANMNESREVSDLTVATVLGILQGRSVR